MKNHSILVLASIAGALSFTPATAVADEYGDEDKVVVTDFTGKPPFKRQIVSRGETSPTPQTKSAESTDDGADRVQLVELRGAPPFKRQIVAVEELESAEFAQLETSDDDVSDTRRGPPGKLTSRR